ncbi:MAG TPA: pyridoxamine 5'-phosphate oxidase family protein [Actinocrinis sp.]|nr:pyridoxamine 5'-phosphate oxidase family protein [Actinocrinis sp.]
MTNLSEDEIEFLQKHRSAAMITVDTAGVAKAARVGVALVDGRLWSSGTADRVRTRRLRRDPRCTLFVFDGTFLWLSAESRVTILDGPDAADLNLRLFRVMQGRPTGPLNWFGAEIDEDAFRTRMAEEGRLIYEFEVVKSYGVVKPPSF